MGLNANIGGDPTQETLVDRWLRFPPGIEDQYNYDHAAGRLVELRNRILISLVFYNVYILTALILTPDIFWLVVVLRFGLVGIASIGVYLVLGWVTPSEREWIAMGVITVSVLSTILVFYLTRADYGFLVFVDVSLLFIGAHQFFGLRFRHTCVMCIIVIATMLLAVAVKPGLDQRLVWAISFQILNIGVFVLFCSYVNDRRQCHDYVTAYLARAETAASETARRRFKKLARTDDLTGLPNRRHLEEVLEVWVSEPRPLAVLMIDIDHFKLYNDTLGHPAGDECLRQVAAKLKALTEDRDNAFCARLGGEEFTIALRGGGEYGSARLARTVVQEIERMGIAHPGRTDDVDVVTISVGIGRKDGRNPMVRGDLLARADEALYEAKRGGRNRFRMGAVPEEIRTTAEPVVTPQAGIVSVST